MNPLNYGSLEACQRLHEKGIELRTDFYWHLVPDKDPELLFEAFAGMLDCPPECKLIPAPSMAEVWRELPEMISYCHRVYWLTLIKGSNASIADYVCVDGSSLFIAKGLKAYENINLVDALIDLLIWVKGNKK
jgi:hypothetical protein